MPLAPMRTACVAAGVALSLLYGTSVPASAAGQPPDPAAKTAPPVGTSLAEKIACAYLLVGGSIMLYYGPRERENGQLTMDGKSEAVGGAVAIGLSIALLRDIIKRRPARPHP